MRSSASASLRWTTWTSSLPTSTPRVVDHLRNARAGPPRLELLTGIGDDGLVALAGGYREYFASLGRSIGRVENAPPRVGPGALQAPAGHLYKRLQVSAGAARVVRAEQLDVVTERLTGETFDLIIATNVLPYFDDDALLLALANIAGMLDANGVLLHNEARPALLDIAAALGLPPTQSRHAVIATVEGHLRSATASGCTVAFPRRIAKQSAGALACPGLQSA